MILKNNEKYLFLISSFLVVLVYLPFREIISWGGYAGYVLQAPVSLSVEFYEFIEKQEILYSYSIVQIDPIYTPIGLPILINLTSWLHDWSLYKIKLLVPIFLLLTIFVIIRNYKFKLRFLYFIPLINLSIVDEYLDAQSEIPGLFFLFLGLNTKNVFIKNLFLVYSTFFRPTFLPVIFIYYLVQYFETKKANDLFYYLTFQLASYSILKFLFSINFYGDQSNSGQDGVLRLIDLLLSINIDRFHYIVTELGRTFTGFTNNLNFFIGIFIFISSLLFKNKYGYMSAVFIFLHFGWDFPYFTRFFIPVVFFYTVALGIYLNKFESKYFQSKYYITSILFVTCLYSFQIFNEISKLESQRGPFQKESIEMLSFINKYEKNTLFSFHSPRVLRVITGYDSYKYDSDYIEGSVIICELSIEYCDIPPEYYQVFSNKTFAIYEN